MEELIVQKRPVFECILHSKREQSVGQEVGLGLVPLVVDEDVSVTKADFYYDLKSTRKALNESLTSPSRLGFIYSKLSEISKIYGELNFDNGNVYLLSFNILQELARNKKFDVKISKTSEKEILIYTEKDGKFDNLLIDNDADVQYIHVGKKVGEERSNVYSFEEIKDYSIFASLI
jgi:hypothetical protein